jgi:hypothetical protein
MPRVRHAEGFHWAATPGDINRRALATSGVGVSVVDDADPADQGARRITVPAGASLQLPMDGDLGTSWAMSLYYGMTPGDGGFGTLVFAPTNAGGDLGVNLMGFVNQFNPATRRLQIRIGTSVVFNFADGSGVQEAAYRVEVVEHPSAGTVRAWRDNELVADLDSLNTARAFACDRVHYGAAAGATNGSRFSHAVLGDGADFGPGTFVGWSPAASDEGPNEFTRSNAGIAHYQHLAEAPHDGDGTTLTSGPDGEGEVTRHGLVGAVGSVVSVRPVMIARGTGDVQLYLVSGSADPELADVSILDPEEYTAFAGAWLDEDPDTTTAWSGIEGVILGVEHLAGES